MKRKFRALDIESQTIFEVGSIEFFDDDESIILNGTLPATFRGKQLRVLLQFTGINELSAGKLGKEIYEGDLVRGRGPWGSTSESKVYFGCDGAQVGIGGQWINLSDFTERVVVGSVHELRG